MIRKIKNSSLFNSKILFVCSFITLAGISTGLFSAMLLSVKEHASLSSLLVQALESGSCSTFSATGWNAIMIVLIFLSGLSIYGFPLAALLLFSKSLSLGFCTSLVFSADPAFSNLFRLLLPNTLILISLLIAASASTVYGMQLMRQSVDMKDLLIPYCFLFIPAAAIVLLSSALLLQ